MRKTSFASVMTLALACGMIGTLPAVAQRDRNPPSASQIADRIDARIAKLKADLRLSDDQSKNWGSVQTALHDIGVNRANRLLRRDEPADAQRDPNAPRDANAPPPPRDANDRDRSRVPDEIDRMRREADYLTDRAADLRKLADAAGPLYGSLDEGQRRRFIQYLRSDRDEERDIIRDERMRSR